MVATIGGDGGWFLIDGGWGEVVGRFSASVKSGGSGQKHYGGWEVDEIGVFFIFVSGVPVDHYLYGAPKTTPVK